MDGYSGVGGFVHRADNAEIINTGAQQNGQVFKVDSSDGDGGQWRILYNSTHFFGAECGIGIGLGGGGKDGPNTDVC